MECPRRPLTAADLAFASEVADVWVELHDSAQSDSTAANFLLMFGPWAESLLRGQGRD